jgi:hypothetical protein
MLRPSNIASTIASEEAVIERRFSAGPFGLLFHGDDGRAWKVREDQATGFKSRANDQMLAFIARSSAVEISTIAIGLAMAALVGFLWDWTTGSRSSSVGAATLAFFSVHPLMPFIRLWRFRREQKAMREEFVRSLGLISPLPIEAAKPYHQTNIWYPLMYAVIFIMVAAVIGLEVFAGHSFDGTFSASGTTVLDEAPMPDMQFLVLLMLPGLVLAWLFYFLAKAQDRKQRR